MRIRVRRDDIDDLCRDDGDGGNPGNAARQRHLHFDQEICDFLFVKTRPESMRLVLVQWCFVALLLSASTCPGVTEVDIDPSPPPLVRAGPAMED